MDRQPGSLRLPRLPPLFSWAVFLMAFFFIVFNLIVGGFDAGGEALFIVGIAYVIAGPFLGWYATPTIKVRIDN